jgi:protein phosphatase
MLNKHFNLLSSVCCEKGDSRSNNQDSTLIRQSEIAGYTVGMYLVADGCGGMAHGEKISHLLEVSFDVIWREQLPILFASEQYSEDMLFSALFNWLEQINEVAFSFGVESGEKVGSTLTLLLLVDDSYYILNVGDSRVYLYRKGTLTQLTEDHSLLADMLRNGEITQEEAKNYERKNVLTMCVGAFEHIQIFRSAGKLRRGDIFLLCSDGFYGVIGDDNLQMCMPKQIDENSAKKLRDYIPYGEAKDNVSVLLVQVL